VTFCMCFSSPLCVLHAQSISSSWLDHPHNISWSVQVTKHLIMQLSPVSSFLGPDGFISTLFADIL
jgi:hypothetical protein